MPNELTRYRFSSLGNGYTHTTPLALSYEIRGTSMSDDYLPSEKNAVELLREWIEHCYPDEHAEQRYGPGMVSIYWGVMGIAEAGIGEVAPFQAHDQGAGDFLTSFTWPVDVDTGEKINWMTMPVSDRAWISDEADKGGFIQQATGWKPAPLQSALHLPGLIAAVPHLTGILPYTPSTTA